MRQKKFQLLVTVYRIEGLLPKHILLDDIFYSRQEAKQFYYDNKIAIDQETMMVTEKRDVTKSRVNVVVTA